MGKGDLIQNAAHMVGNRLHADQFIQIRQRGLIVGLAQVERSNRLGRNLRAFNTVFKTPCMHVEDDIARNLLDCRDAVEIAVSLFKTDNLIEHRPGRFCQFIIVFFECTTCHLVQLLGVEWPEHDRFQGNDVSQIAGDRLNCCCGAIGHAEDNDLVFIILFDQEQEFSEIGMAGTVEPVADIESNDFRTAASQQVGK